MVDKLLCATVLSRESGRKKNLNVKKHNSLQEFYNSRQIGFFPGDVLVLLLQANELDEIRKLEGGSDQS